MRRGSSKAHGADECPARRFGVPHEGLTFENPENDGGEYFVDEVQAFRLAADTSVEIQTIQTNVISEAPEIPSLSTLV